MMDRVEKLCFIDVETTGLNPVVNGLTQIAGDICKIKDGELVSLEEFNWDLQPLDTDVIEPKALEVQGKTLDDIKKNPIGVTVYEEFIKLLDNHVDKYNKEDKMMFLAYNARFDNDFIRAWFEKYNNKFFGSYFWFPPIDVMNMAIWKVGTKRCRLESFSLGSVAKYFGLEPEGDLHDAKTDIDLTKRLFWKLVGEDGLNENGTTDTD